MEFRLGNQQRHSITAVLLSAVVVVFGLVLVDILSSPDVDPLGTQTAAIETSTTLPEPVPSEAGDDQTAGVARSNARFTLNPDVTVGEVESSTSTTAAVRRTTAAPAVVTTAAPTTSIATTSTTSQPPDTSASTAPPTSTSSTTTPTTVATTVKPPGKPSTTVVDDETTTTKKCRGNRPGCREP